MNGDGKALPEWSRPGDGPVEGGGGGVQPKHKLDRYELIARIASGGMGMVFLARLEGVGGFQRLFAIKLMHPHLAADAQFIAMFLDEARLAARIHHPNAVSIIDVCASESGYYLVMEYVEGFTLDDILDLPSMEQQEKIRLALRVLIDASAGLHAAHDLKGDDGSALDLVHRDVSPQNILVGVDGVGRITDFGVARAAARITASRPGMIKGKPCYMAPEQARGEALDRRADVFALGIILWEILTGDQLFWSEAGEAAMLVRVMYDPIEPPSVRNPNVPPALDAVVMKALDRNPAERHQTAREFMEELEQGARGAGCLVSNHHLADRMRDVFRDDIRARRASIQRHIEQLGDVVSSDVYDVPQLSVRPSLPPAPPAPSRSGQQPLTPTVASPRGSLRSPTSGSPASTTGAPAVIAMSSTAGTTGTGAPSASGGRRWTLVIAGLLLTALGAAAVFGVLALRPGTADQDTEAPEVAGQPGTEPAQVPPDVTEPTGEPTETSAPTEVAGGDEQGTTEALPAGVDVPVETEAEKPNDPPEPRRARGRRRHGREPSMRDRRNREPSMDDPAPSDEIPVETNPYY